MHHPKVSDAAVIGVLDVQAGEVAKAFIVKKINSLTGDEINNYVRGDAEGFISLGLMVAISHLLFFHS